jgi:hypothetical protein
VDLDFVLQKEKIMNQQINDRQLSDKEIATCAYYLWESDGRPAGRDEEYWFKAKAQLAKRPVQPATTKALAMPPPSAARTESSATRTESSTENGDKARKRKMESRPTPATPAKQAAYV